MRAIAARACAELKSGLHAIHTSDIPTCSTERNALARLWEREAVLSNRALLVEGDIADHARTVTSLIENIRSLLIVATPEPMRLKRRSSIRLEVDKPSITEQLALWQDTLGPSSAKLNGQLEKIIANFSLDPESIYEACAQAMGGQSPKEEVELDQKLWEACRTQARRPLDELAQRIKPMATWQDLVLPESQSNNLREIAAHVRQRTKVYETWGFARKASRGLGISALFVGASGTGKTMAAEVLANELQLDLYRIDLSQVVNKYIGETEKNLRRVFDAADDSGAILLFDEADALFGKRSDVKDSHDRYANIEVSYLLQRMEEYRGLAILTTNMKKALDQAFLRRIRFVVQFPFPDAGLRAEIWQRIFPSQTPTEGLDIRKLARLDIAGGNIRNIALNAAFVAAEAGESVMMPHVEQAARSEYRKLEKQMTGSELALKNQQTAKSNK
jgi:SpoVK/Ycf46/Vps4 family AAA+-type ATPase